MYKNFFKVFTIYTGASFINQAIAIILLPVLTRFLSPGDYGVVATFASMVGIVSIFISMGGVDAMTREYFEKGSRGHDFSVFVSNAIYINIAAFSFIFAAFVLFGPFISKAILIPAPWLLLIPVVGLCHAIYSIALKMFSVEQRPVPYAAMHISDTVIEITLSLFLVIIAGLTWKGRILGIAISRFLFLGIAAFIIARKYITRRTLRLDCVKSILCYGAPVFLHSTGLAVIAGVDRIFLNRFAGLAQTGIYSVAYAVSLAVALLAGTFNLAWAPLLYEKLGRATGEFKVKIVKSTYLYLIGMIVAALSLSAIAQPLLRIFVGEQFYPAAGFILWLSLGWVMYGMNVMVSNYIFYAKKTYPLIIVALITVAASVVFNYILIRRSGAYGAAQAMFLTFSCRLAAMWYFSNKVYPMPWFCFLKGKKWA